MARLAAGDRAAFDQVYDLAWPVVRTFTTRALPNAADAEDIAQDTLLKVFGRASTFDHNRGDGLAWILTLARYEALTQRNKAARRREAPAVDRDDAPSDALDPEAVAIERDLADAVNLALQQLSPEEVATLQAKLGDRPRPDIDGATFRKRVQRAMTRLSDAWRTRHET